MTVIAAICALTTAACVGYYAGRRGGRTRPHRKKRTSRVALGKQVISLVAMIAARRIQQGLRRERTFSDRWGPRLIVPLAFLRGSVVRMRSY